MSRRKKRKLRKAAIIAFFASIILTFIWMIKPYLNIFGCNFFIFPITSWGLFIAFWLTFQKHKTPRAKVKVEQAIEFFSKAGVFFGGIFLLLSSLGCVCQCILYRFPKGWDIPFWYVISPETAGAFKISLWVFAVSAVLTVFINRGEPGILS